MDKMRMESIDMTEQNIEKIGALFPNCITEAKDTDGKLKKAINFDMLRQMLSGDVIEGDEAYEFTWVGKKAAIVEANKPIRKTLRPCKEESVNWDSTENLYIEGDNLEVLKLLQESYLGKVKMIYIDPPYNTGNDFIYRDDFKQSATDYDEDSGVYDEDGNRMFKNTDTNGRFHSDWCSMIYSRLMLARNFMTEDGIVFVSIDDNEVNSLISLGKEIFGDSNYIATFIWEKRKTRENRKIVSIRHDYIVCFIKNFDERINAIGLEQMNEDAIERYKNPDNDPRGVWTSVPAIAQAGHGTKSQFYTLISPKGLKFNPPSGSCWRYTESKMKEAIDDNRIWFGSDGTGVPRIKKFLTEGKQGLTPETMLLADAVGTNDSAKRELVSLFEGVAVFETPKPVSLVAHLISICIYNSAQLTEIDRFASDNSICAMIINSQAFNARGKDARRISMKLDEFRSRRPIDIIAKTNPILIIDEPQSVEGKQTKENLKQFNPLLTLRYSATHKSDSIYNMVYRLDAMEAYNKRLVKKIAVKGISESGSTATESYVYLESINLSKAAPTATIQFDYKGASGIRKITRTVSEGYNLYDNSGNMEEYKQGFVVSHIDGRDDSVEFLNGIKIYAGDVIGKVSEDQLRRIQIRETILSHIQRERELFYNQQW